MKHCCISELCNTYIKDMNMTLEEYSFLSTFFCESHYNKVAFLFSGTPIMPCRKGVCMINPYWCFEFILSEYFYEKYD